MQIAYFPDAPRPKWTYPVVGLGNFDGVHRGHRKLLDEVRRHAEERTGTAVAMIFDPHPPKVLRPEKAPPLLMTLEQKLSAFEQAGMAAVAVVRFTKELSRWEPETFVETVIIDWLRASEVWVGANFLFGRDRSGTFTLLRAIGQDRGFKVDKIEPVFYKDFVVSSTRIRHLVGEGRVDEAGALLGHHYTIDGEVVRGDGRGRDARRPLAPGCDERRRAADDRGRPPHGRDAPARRSV
jgi:riboflavin kinase/FMN adenylyltransferase